MSIENTEAYVDIQNHISRTLPSSSSDRILIAMSNITKGEDPLRISVLLKVVSFLMKDGVFVVEDSSETDSEEDDKVISTSSRRSINLLNSILSDTLVRVVPTGELYEVVVVSKFM